MHLPIVSFWDPASLCNLLLARTEPGTEIEAAGKFKSQTTKYFSCQCSTQRPSFFQIKTAACQFEPHGSINKTCRFSRHFLKPPGVFTHRFSLHCVNKILNQQRNSIRYKFVGAQVFSYNSDSRSSVSNRFRLLRKLQMTNVNKYA